MNVIKEIERLKKERNAIILAHYYQPGEIQEIADYVGDSYYLSKTAQQSEADYIVFCGVEFMAESAKILSPEKRVFIGNVNSNCNMVDEFLNEELEDLMKKNPDAAVVSYINSSTEIKTMSHACCTSSSALDIVNNIESDKIIFVPDKNLGGYIAAQCPDKEVILGSGKCCVHDNVRAKEVKTLMEKYPHAKVLVHPESQKDVRDLADFIGSTGQILNHATVSEDDEFIIVTEVGIRFALDEKTENKSFYFPDMVCGGMKRTSIDDVYRCLRFEENEIQLDVEMSNKAAEALENMIKLAEKR
ncbi:quinolinate synthetase [Dethiosulfatibacter aminovorans DSM 17477]|uniref:Quinolinate synthase n=1 Tax=Dethiosulfatibacter aminovorans DSM 17477 TaxID=1121476 RepID=A0A1M6E726_9FIRM|nr:quinolinate synthase NadA [Dethiosulfatibacter aminovorans]SHI81334.1 quinolinate synthetase [Dethiosulfatibacter aminovorans DSM 17477]